MKLLKAHTNMEAIMLLEDPVTQRLKKEDQSYVYVNVISTVHGMNNFKGKKFFDQVFLMKLHVQRSELRNREEKETDRVRETQTYTKTETGGGVCGGADGMRERNCCIQFTCTKLEVRKNSNRKLK